MLYDILITLTSHYDLLLVSKDTSLDPGRTPPVTRRELKLWDELRILHVSLRDASACASEPNHNYAYFEHIDARMKVVEQEAVAVALNQEDPRIAHRLHTHRRALAILYQELELLTMSVPQSRAIGRDAAFIACGRRYAG